MKFVALGLLAAAAACAAAPAQAGVFIEYNSGPARFYRPPPPVVYRPAPRVYVAAPAPREVCRVSYVREWGAWGPRTRRVETCRERW